MSTTESGLLRKGEHKTEFVFTAHVACDENNFVLAFEVTPGNVHDSKMFDAVYDEVTSKFENVETVAVDAAYKTPWICKKVTDDDRNISTPYKRPMTGKGFFRSYMGRLHRSGGRFPTFPGWTCNLYTTKPNH